MSLTQLRTEEAHLLKQDRDYKAALRAVQQVRGQGRRNIRWSDNNKSGGSNSGNCNYANGG